jgi:hypothetical protein
MQCSHMHCSLRSCVLKLLSFELPYLLRCMCCQGCSDGNDTFYEKEVCFLGASGQPILLNNTVACDIAVSGIDQQVCPHQQGGVVSTIQL